MKFSPNRACLLNKNELGELQVKKKKKAKSKICSNFSPFTNKDVLMIAMTLQQKMTFENTA